jgi:hypothetical protein
VLSRRYATGLCRGAFHGLSVNWRGPATATSLLLGLARHTRGDAAMSRFSSPRFRGRVSGRTKSRRWHEGQRQQAANTVVAANENKELVRGGVRAGRGGPGAIACCTDEADNHRADQGQQLEPLRHRRLLHFASPRKVPILLIDRMSDTLDSRAREQRHARDMLYSKIEARQVHRILLGDRQANRWRSTKRDALHILCSGCRCVDRRLHDRAESGGR